MAITIINQKSIVEINAEKQELEDKDLAVGRLGQELAQEKMKSMQKDIVILNLGQEISRIKLDVMQIKGGK